MFKDEILAILRGFQQLAEIDFAQLAEDEEKENKKYIEGYLDAVDDMRQLFEKNL